MRAFITLPDRSVVEVVADLATIMEMGAKPGHEVFIPACLCGSTHHCKQHPKFKRRID